MFRDGTRDPLFAITLLETSPGTEVCAIYAFDNSLMPDLRVTGLHRW